MRRSLPLALSLLLTLISSGCRSLASRAMMESRRLEVRRKQFESQISQFAHNTNGVLLIDGDNVRGKTAFSMSHPELLARSARWATRHGLAGRVVLLVDHGSQPSAIHLPRLGDAAVVFSGPRSTADDVAARDISWLHARGHDVILVTADSGLALRCRRAATSHSLSIVPPQSLLAALGPVCRSDDAPTAGEVSVLPTPTLDPGLQPSPSRSPFTLTLHPTPHPRPHPHPHPHPHPRPGWRAY